MDIYGRMHRVYDKAGPCYATVKIWTRMIRHDRETLQYDPHSGRPTTAYTEEIVVKVHKKYWNMEFF